MPYLDHRERREPRDMGNLAHVVMVGILIALALLGALYYGLGAALWLAEKVRPL